MKLRLLVTIFACTLLAFSCQDKTASNNASADSTAAAANVPVKIDSAALPATPDSSAITRLAADLMKLAADKNYAAIADFIHPTKGIRFSPYAYIDVEQHKHFTAAEFRTQATEGAKKKVLWGEYDPMEGDIKATVEGYFKEFGYDKDYLGKGKSAYNEALGSSTIIDNTAEIYPNDNFVDYYYGGSDPEKEPFEWGSIRLVFEVLDGKPYVLAWIHNAWST